jgi:diacylglycerol kinase family enzyme
MDSFSHIAIIFNPESTGDAPALAKKLARDLKERGFRPKLEPTNHAGHATEIACRISHAHERPLIISVSGDGGYNEVINGAMEAKNKSKKARPVVSVLGAGNANDHYRVMHDRPIVDLITEHSVRPLDLISISATTSKTSFSRYAHSYIGFGITPEVGDELNRHGKNFLSEMKLVIKTFMKFRPFEIIHDGQTRLCDSLVFANINEMAKFVKLDEKNTIHDGKFEVIEFAHRGKPALLTNMLRAAITGIKNPPSYSTYSFSISENLAVQSDGEIDQLPKGSFITITSHAKAIDSLF